MFKPANPDSRFPAYLQNHTKENAIWQLKLTAAFLAGFIIWDVAREKLEERRRNLELQIAQ